MLTITRDEPFPLSGTFHPVLFPNVMIFGGGERKKSGIIKQHLSAHCWAFFNLSKHQLLNGLKSSSLSREDVQACRGLLEGTRYKWILSLGGHKGAGIPGFQSQFVWNQLLRPESKSWDTLLSSFPMPCPWASTQHPAELVFCQSHPGFGNQEGGLGNTVFKNHRDIYKRAPGGMGLLSSALYSGVLSKRFFFPVLGGSNLL